MPYCIRCSETTCIGDGISSVTMNTSSSARPAKCDDGDKYLPGPTTGSVSVTAWARGADLWLGSRCRGQASASQSNIVRYDLITNKWYIIPSEVHNAQIVGEVPLASLGCIFFTGVSLESQLLNGVSITTEMGVEMGAKFTFGGGVAGAPNEIPDKKAYNIDVAGVSEAYVNSISISVDYPNNPATVTYTFDFPIEMENSSC